MNDSLPLLFAVSTMGNRKNLNLKRFPKENFLSPKGCKEGNSLGTLAKEQASIGWIPRYIASVFLVSPLRFDFRRLPGPVLIRLPGPVLSAGSFSRTAAGNRAYPWPFGRYVDTDVDKFASHFSRQSSGHGQKKNKCPMPLLGETLTCQ